jgi:hypothetical protein
MSIDKFVEFTQVINNDYRILYIDVKCSGPTPLQWKFCINEMLENFNLFKELDCKFALVFEAKLVGIISTEYILDFINVLVENRVSYKFVKLLSNIEPPTFLFPVNGFIYLST